MIGWQQDNRKRYKQAAISVSLFMVFFLLIYSIVHQPWNDSTSSVAITTADLREDDTPVVKAATDEKASTQQTERIDPASLESLDYHQWASQYHLDKTNNRSSQDPDADGFSNQLEYAHLTNPTDKDTDKDGYPDQQELLNGYDPDASGDAKPEMKISIRRIGVEAPVVWSTSELEADLQEDLKEGVIHLPKTASPGQPGNMVITGHSSNYSWVEGRYNDIFKNLNDLETGDTVTITTKQQNGRVNRYHYRVTGKRVTTADDPAIFEQPSQPILSLATCWPIGTNLKRLIVTAELAT